MRGDARRLVETLSGPGIYLADAETAADLGKLAWAGQAAGIRVFCGSAGLARGIVHLLPEGQHMPAFRRRSGSVLVIAGSRAAATVEQVQVLQQAGIGVFALIPEMLQIRDHLEDLALRIVEQLKNQVSVVIHVDGLRHGDPTQICAGLASLASGVMSSVPLGGLILTGGETAAAVCRALGCAALDLGGEVQPGVVWGRLGDGTHAGLPVITKAGGFGSPRALADALQFLVS